MMPFDLFAAFRTPQQPKRKDNPRERRFYLPGAGITQVPPVDALAAGLIPVGSYTYPYKPTQQNIVTARRYSVGDDYTRRMLDALVDGAVGMDGIQFVFANARAQELWDNWAWNRSAPFERIDDLQRDMVKGVIRDGEAFYDVSADGEGPFVTEIDPLQIDIESGVKYASDGRATSYMVKNLDSDVPSSVSAERIIHMYRHDFPQQRRGTSWMTPTFPYIDKLRQVEHYMVMAFRNIANNPYYITLSDDAFRGLPAKPTNDTSTNRLDLEAGLGDEDPAEFPDSDTPEDYPSPVQVFKDLDGTERFAVVQGVEFNTIELPAGLRTAEYAELKRSLLTRIAKGLGLSYQAVYGDIRDANYSSMRHAVLQDQATYRRVQRILEVGLQGIYERWALAMSIMEPRLDLSILRVVRPTWESIDPSKDVAADVALVDSALFSRQELIRARGADPEQVFEEILAERELLGQMNAESEDGDGGDNTGEDTESDDSSEVDDDEQDEAD